MYSKLVVIPNNDNDKDIITNVYEQIFYISVQYHTLQIIIIIVNILAVNVPKHTKVQPRS